MKEALINFFTQPLVIGICIGLAGALVVWIRGILNTRELKSAAAAKEDRFNAELEHLQKHLHTQMEITAKGNSSINDELKAAKDTIDNLQQAVGVLKQKPGRAELRSLHLYEKAIRIMNSRAPGFGAAWESALQDAEAEVKKEESGIMGWIKKPFLLNKSASVDVTESQES
ncbi:MAG: hypothetical protein ACSHX8_06765 [Opitutaceae bacterium]